MADLTFIILLVSSFGLKSFGHLKFFFSALINGVLFAELVSGGGVRARVLVLEFGQGQEHGIFGVQVVVRDREVV